MHIKRKLTKWLMTTLLICILGVQGLALPLTKLAELPEKTTDVALISAINFQIQLPPKDELEQIHRLAIKVKDLQEKNNDLRQESNLKTDKINVLQSLVDSKDKQIATLLEASNAYKNANETLKQAQETYQKMIDKKDEQIVILEKKLASEKKWGKVKTVVSVIATAAILLVR